MGDRVSIQFRNGNDTSIAMFSHWGGTGFANEAEEYARELVNEGHGKGSDPLGRLEPCTVMVDFIRWYTRKEYGDERVMSTLYLGKDPNDGDNSDNGNFIIEFIQKDNNAPVEVVVHGG